MTTREVQWPDSLSTREVVEGRIARMLGALPGAWLLKLIGEAPTVVDGLTLDPHVQFLIAARRRRPPLLLCEPTVESGRRRYRREIQAVAESSGARPTRVRAVNTISIPGAAGPMMARHYTPPGSPPNSSRPLLVYLHGGGFVLGDLDTHDEPCRLLCHHADVHVLSVGYRLAPEHPFPAAYDDACAALEWAQDNAGALGANAARVCIGGDSAGANLAATASLALAARGRGPAAQLLLYPATDFTSAHPSRSRFGEGFILTGRDMDAFTAHYLGSDLSHRSDPRASPALSPAVHLSPPTLVTTADFDPLRDEGELFADQLRMAGVMVRLKRIAGLPHAYIHMTTVVPAAVNAMIATAIEFNSLLASLTAAQIATPDREVR